LSNFFQWVQLRWEVIVRFVDIVGIDYHHCLNSNRFCVCLSKLIPNIHFPVMSSKIYNWITQNNEDKLIHFSMLTCLKQQDRFWWSGSLTKVIKHIGLMMKCIIHFGTSLSSW
jgi:hypothetical protein